MLSKLLKHEFRATGRIMLPALVLLAALSALTDLTFFAAGRIDNDLINTALTLFIIAYVVCMMEACIMCFVLMVLRFRRSLLGEEGYISMTLPVTVHGHIWCKLIVSLAWFAITAIVCCLAVGITAVTVGDVSMSDVSFFFRAAAEPYRRFLEETNITVADLIGCAMMFLLLCVSVCVSMCLRFYAALSLGHMAANRKWLLSLAAYVGLTAVVRITTIISGVRISDTYGFELLGSAEALVRGAVPFMGLCCVYLAVQGAVFYVITAAAMKRSLNLA